MSRISKLEEQRQGIDREIEMLKNPRTGRLPMLEEEKLSKKATINFIPTELCRPRSDI